MNIFNDETIIYYKSHGSPMEEGMMCEIFGVTYKNDKILHVIQLIFVFLQEVCPSQIQQASAKLRNVFVKALLWC